MTEIFPNIYTLPIPLKNSPLKWINCYIIKGERGLVVDTAFNRDESEQAILAALDELGLSPDQTDYFITHMHVDHSGLVERLKHPANRVYASAQTAKMINGFQHPEHWDWVTKNNIYTGVPEDEALHYSGHVAYINRPDREIEFSIVQEGDHLQAGGYDFEVVDLSGHAPGQYGLYQPEQGILFCGDHILDRITPNITAWDLENDYLGIYLENLKKVRALQIRRLLTAHRELPESADARIGFLLQHHENRLQEVRNILAKMPRQTAYQVAREMQWSINKDFSEFPKMQKWFACSEALAHLQYLYNRGEVERESESEVLYYTLNKRV